MAEEEHVSKKLKTSTDTPAEESEKKLSYPEKIPEDVKSFFVVFFHSHVDYDPSACSTMKFKAPFNELATAVYALCHIFTPKMWMTENTDEFKKLGFSKKDTSILRGLCAYIYDQDLDLEEPDEGQFIECCELLDIEEKEAEKKKKEEGGEKEEEEEEEENLSSKEKLQRYLDKYIPPVFRPLNNWVGTQLSEIRDSKPGKQEMSGTPFKFYDGPSDEECSRIFHLACTTN